MVDLPERGAPSRPTEDERAFIARRERLVHRWPVVGGTLLAGLLALGVWLWIRQPLLANPLAVLARLEAGGIPPETLTLMAGMLPVLVLLCLLLAAVLVLFAFAAFGNEKKYLAIVRRGNAGEAFREAAQ